MDKLSNFRLHPLVGLSYLPPMAIICCDCRTAPDIESYMFPRFEVVTRIHCPDCGKDLKGEEANRMALDEVVYLERRQLMQKRPVSLGGVAVPADCGPFTFGKPNS